MEFDGKFKLLTKDIVMLDCSDEYGELYTIAKVVLNDVITFKFLDGDYSVFEEVFVPNIMNEYFSKLRLYSNNFEDNISEVLAGAFGSEIEVELKSCIENIEI